MSSLEVVLADVAAERRAQERIWGVQEFPDGTGPEYEARADEAKAEVGASSKRGRLTWRHILTEEFYEALAESDPVRLRTELVQTAAVAVQWIQSLDRRHGGSPHATTANTADGREKLVRDRIPEIIERAGRTPEARVAEDGEFETFLRAKLYEEAGEYVSSGDPAELADILEVVHALAAVHGLDQAELEHLRAAKAAERGGFTARLVLRTRPTAD
ncbi:nucleoside triphosphate pyrophosphohydrolase [Spirillospora sp. NPDC047279]|uniref:nucleoside triphosphate pyrophosphohydrolase n=1 Tax=Spirillospora sp. NPDC047279 TaxID=3155478 RepID=UPI0033DDA7FF